MHVVYVCNKGPSNDDVGVARGTVFEEVRSGARVKTGDFVNEKLGGGGYRGTTLTMARFGMYTTGAAQDGSLVNIMC